MEDMGANATTRRLLAVFESSVPSVIHRQDIIVRANAQDAEILLAIAAAWNQMASDALADKRKPPQVEQPT